MDYADKNSVWITSVGLVTPWGLGLEACREGLAGRQPLPEPARCPPVDLADYLPSEKTYLDRCSELALLGAALALLGGGVTAGVMAPQLQEGAEQVGLVQADRFGLALGTAYGCLDSMYANSQRVQTKGARLASPLLFMHSFANAPASLIAIEWGLRGPGCTFTDGSLSAASALSWSVDLLRRGQVDMMLVGGVEALSEPLLRAVEADPALARGETPVEAAAFFLLERGEMAARRGTSPLAQVEAATVAWAPPTGRRRGVAALAGRFRRDPRPGWEAFGAHCALRLAQTLAAAPVSARRRRAAGPVSWQEVVGNREGKITLRLA
jgi:3-oxoacyl-(acyl-carrier-protein) synthase